MGQIHVLDLSVANLIAAGEVVERPASAVKELVENAIDAGSTSVTVEIQHGGISLIRVTDNGCGMSAEDAVLAVRRHATSKIQNAADLDAILTLGFRGEALAAITAVSEFRLLTKRVGDDAGTLLSGKYGTVEEIGAAGTPDGTTVICERLFATTPARLKFLKSDSAEGAAVAQTVEKLAVSRPGVSFRFIADGNLKFTTTGDGNLHNAIYSVYGGGFAGKLLAIKATSGGIGVSGYLSAPENTRGNRGMQQFFINQRCVRSKTISSALEAAYRSYIPSDKFPSCVLNIEVPPALVDVNIHPAKMEVKFSNEKAVFDAVYATVRAVLCGGIVRPALPLAPEKTKTAGTGYPSIPPTEQTALDDLFHQAAEKGAESEYKAHRTEKPANDDDFAVDVPPLHTGSLTAGALRASADVKPPESETSKPSAMRERLYGAPRDTALSAIKAREEKEPVFAASAGTDAGIAGAATHPVPPYRLIGEAFASYIIIETEGKLLLIDKHAAHERTNFERLRANMTLQNPAIQLLLLSEPLSLTTEEDETFRAYRRELEAVGFEFSEEKGTVSLTGIPQDFTMSEAKALLTELITRVMENGESIAIHRRDYFERALYQSSCKASVKAGRVYDEAHIRWICDNLLRYDCVKFCPHGRPVAFELSKKELDSHFGRT